MGVCLYWPLENAHVSVVCLLSGSIMTKTPARAIAVLAVHPLNSLGGYESRNDVSESEVDSKNLSL